ncbi:hypothetical protein GGC47_004348 [Bosea sp. OAE752]|jgi:hypothetical protein|uniref:hypothetical protein n=1 Tax=unclassified Bosea (in: a-proteobacteria) TaxID=2653178 RepID=UPI000DDC0BA3
MFWFFEAFAKRINEQAAEYAAAQTQVLKRGFGLWPDLTAQPVRIESSSARDRRLHRLAMAKSASRPR